MIYEGQAYDWRLDPWYRNEQDAYDFEDDGEENDACSKV